MPMLGEPRALHACIHPTSIDGNLVETRHHQTERNPESNPNKRKHVGASYSWNHGTQVLCNDGSPSWECIHCCHVLSLVSSTSNQRSYTKSHTQNMPMTNK